MKQTATDIKRGIALELYKLVRQPVQLTSGEITMLENACVAQFKHYQEMARAAKTGREVEQYSGYADKYAKLEKLLEIERAQLECEVDKRTNLVYLRRQADKRREAAAKRKLAKTGKAVAK